MNPFPLLQTMERIRGEIWEEDGRLKFRIPAAYERYAPELVQEMKRQKPYLLKALQLEKHLKETGWLILARWEAYEKRITANHSLFIFRDDNGWMVWRATWQPGRPDPVKEKVLRENLTFEEAVQSANGYIHWLQNKRSA